MSEFVDYYKILQADRDADADVVEALYKRLIFKHHPDRGGDPETAKRITGAYYVLKDQTRRREYDSVYAQWAASPSTANTSGYVNLDEIPQSAIDYILAATFTEMAAATVRTAGRVAGAVAVTGAVAVAGAASAGVEAVLESRRRAQAVKSAEADRVWRMEEARAQQSRWALETTRGTSEWTPVPSKAAVEEFRKQVAVVAPFSSRFAHFGDDDLTWIAVRHPASLTRAAAFEALQTRHKAHGALVGVVSAFHPPVLLGDSNDSFKRLGETGLFRTINAARWVDAKEHAEMCRDARRARLIRGAILTVVTIALGVALLWTQTSVLQDVLANYH